MRAHTGERTESPQLLSSFTHPLLTPPPQDISTELTALPPPAPDSESLWSFQPLIYSLEHNCSLLLYSVNFISSAKLQHTLCSIPSGF